VLTGNGTGALPSARAEGISIRKLASGAAAAGGRGCGRGWRSDGHGGCRVLDGRQRGRVL